MEEEALSRWMESENQQETETEQTETEEEESENDALASRENEIPDFHVVVEKCF